MQLKSSYSKYILEAGCDEAGRGCLAGPVCAAAVILDKKKKIKGLDDSKKLTSEKRELLRHEIMNKAKFWAVGWATQEEIDKINILNASILAMHRALDQITIQPEFIIVDGNRFKKYKNILHKTLVKGDANYKSIAAASILAKTFRDEWMAEQAKNFPVYGWDKNMGYPTKFHRDAIKKFGLSELHRKTFRSGTEQLSFDFGS